MAVKSEISENFITIESLLYGAIGHQPSVIKHYSALADVFDQCEIMAGDKTGMVEISNHVYHSLPGIPVEIACRFVKHKN